MTILIVEDREQDRYLLQTLLHGFGYEVKAASHGQEALDLARQQPPELIVTDILMPIMDGFTLCRQWQQDPQLQSIPFVFYTASYTDPRDEQFALSLGADLFLIKPQEPNALHEALQGLLENKDKTESRPVQADNNETIYLKQYNEVLIRKLEDKMAYLQAIIDTAANVIIEMSPQYEIREFNPGAEWLYKTAREQVLGTNFLEQCLQPDERENIHKKMERIIGAKSSVNFESTFTRPKDGGNRVLFWNVVGIAPPQKPLSGIIAVGTDITAIKETQKQLRTLSHKLAQTEEKVRREIGLFLHDHISQSLASCKLMIDTEQHQAHNPDLKEKFGTISQLMMTAMEETQQLTSNLVPVVLHRQGLYAAIEDWLEDNLGKGHNIKIHVEHQIRDKDIPEDISLFIFRTIKELGFNVIKYAQAHTVHVQIKPRGQFIWLAFSDDGIGFDPQSPQQHDPQGTGIGLFSIKERIEYMGGYFHIDSSPNHGAMIEMRIPTNPG